MTQRKDLTVPVPAPLEAPGHWRERAEAWLAELAADLAIDATEWATLAAEPVPDVVDDVTYAHADACLRTARDAVGALEDRRKAFTGPLHEVKTRIDALYRPLTTAAKSIEQAHRAAITAYETRR
jgi:hypothetical protein